MYLYRFGAQQAAEGNAARGAGWAVLGAVAAGQWPWAKVQVVSCTSCGLCYCGGPFLLRFSGFGHRFHPCRTCTRKTLNVLLADL